MKLYESSKIKNFCLLGHGNSGKTSLAEAMLYTAGSIERMGRTQDGNTVMDFDPEEIVQRFARGDKARSTKGSGLGLAIARQIVQRHKGAITAASDARATRFTVSLPLRH